jgi:5-methylcytosine-specific restriction endonuclease McrA
MKNPLHLGERPITPATVTTGMRGSVCNADQSTLTKRQRQSLKYRQENKEQIAEKKRLDHAANPEPARERASAWHANKIKDRPPVLCQVCGEVVDRSKMGKSSTHCSDGCIKVSADRRRQAWYERNQEDVKKRNRERARRERVENPQKVKHREQLYYRNNLSRIKVRGKLYQQTHREETNEAARRRQQENPETAAARLAARRRRVRESRNGENPDYLKWMVKVRMSPVYQCFWCRGVFSTRKTSTLNRLTFDHVVPIVLNGIDCRSNLVPCCHSCNSSKNDRNPSDWLAEKFSLDDYRLPPYDYLTIA